MSAAIVTDDRNVFLDMPLLHLSFFVYAQLFQAAELFPQKFVAKFLTHIWRELKTMKHLTKFVLFSMSSFRIKLL